MEAITYDMIAENAAKATTTGSKVEVDWICAATNKPMGKSESYMSTDHSMKNEVAASVKRGVVREIGYAIVNFFSSLVGGSAGRVVRDATSSASYRVSSNVSSAAQYTEKSKRDAIVAAFKQVEKNFTWNEKDRKFVAA